MYRKTYACLNEYFTVQYLESDFVLSKERHLKHNSFYVFVSAKNKQDGHLLYFDVARQSLTWMQAEWILNNHFMQQLFNKKSNLLACHAIIQTILIRVGRSCQFFRHFNNMRCQFTTTYLFAPVESPFVSFRGPHDKHLSLQKWDHLNKD